MQIKTQKLTEEEIQLKSIKAWPIWEKEISRFDWYYDSTEYCLILEGKVTIETLNEKFEIKAGDFVTFPKGLSCTWDIKENIRKHYDFE